MDKKNIYPKLWQCLVYVMKSIFTRLHLYMSSGRKHATQVKEVKFVKGASTCNTVKGGQASKVKSSGEDRSQTLVKSSGVSPMEEVAGSGRGSVTLHVNTSWCSKILSFNMTGFSESLFFLLLHFLVHETVVFNCCMSNITSGIV